MDRHTIEHYNQHAAAMSAQYESADVTRLHQRLLERLDLLMTTHAPTFEWVRGHQGHAENEAADDRARAVATAIQAGLDDWDPGPGLTC